MYAVDKILKEANVINLLEHYGFDPSLVNGDLIRSKCKIHGGDNPTAFVINTDTSLWYCHTGDCGGGDMFTLVEKMENLSFHDAVKWLSKFFNISIEGLEIKEKKDRLKKELEGFLKAMKSRKKYKIKPYNINADVKEVKKFRSFSSDTIKHFNMGFVESIELEKKDGSNYSLKNRLLFPISFNNEIIGIALRRTKSTDVPKWSNQPVNIDTGAILYNYDNAKSSGTIVVVEGITDVWSYHEIGVSAVSTFGAHLTDEQYKLLMKTGADLVLSYDGDDAGYNATKKAIKMLLNKANVYVVDIPKGKDPESIDREELLKLYECRRKALR